MCPPFLLQVLHRRLAAERREMAGLIAWQPMRELVSRGAADDASLRGRAIIFHRTKIICERNGGKTSPRGVLDVPKGLC